ncbi:acyl-CoA synthetase [Noviherbaspirillum sedimenti]|nr:acyl-CoA synthetase [Noviherbaspirillum sedimenti]
MIGPEHYSLQGKVDYKWRIQEHFNIAREVCDKWADGTGRPALVYEDKTGKVTTYSFDQIKTLSNQLANTLTKAGLRRGDRIGIFLSQGVETLISHVAAYKIGAVTVPLFYLFGPDAISYRLNNSAAKLLITDAAGMGKVSAVRDELAALQQILYVEDPGVAVPDSAQGFWGSLRQEFPEFTTVDTLADDPAIIIYTSGTTGKAKGALHSHRILLGHLPGVEVSHDGFPQAGDLFWTPADWAWIGGLFDVLMPSLYHGIPVLAKRLEKFEPEAVFDLLERHQVRNVFFPPTALKMLRIVEKPNERWHYHLRSVASGGESLGSDLIAWGQQVFGVTINEFYGQTECNLVVSSSATLYPPKPGSMGRAVPGHDVQIVDEQGNVLPAGATGNIAVRRPDPVMFLGYWQNPEATKEKFAGDFLVTGDLGTMDADGYITYLGRNDDVITSAGYRIGPAPIEECLMRHPAVKLAAVIGVKDEVRTEIVKAFIVLRDGFSPSQSLFKEIQGFVRDRLAAHEYPRDIAFVDALPTTPTGKIMRRALKQQEESGAGAIAQ